MTNRLARESSPYLLQHAHNPVDWYPWGPEALERARAEDRPILLSVGYSACHWCHVMERESFEDSETAALMNESFVNVKVDREERPDVDAVYMRAVQSLTGRGGWPLTVFLTPAGEPYYGGTYYPPEPRQGMPSFRQVLQAVRDAWDRRREDVEKAAGEIRSLLERSTRRRAAAEVASAGGAERADAGAEGLSQDLLTRARRSLSADYDARRGGFGDAPKFPQAVVLEALLRHHRATGDGESLSMVRHTLLQMARGGIRDHLGGGFHRYAVDARWLVPHFEKMLYDNALLARVYVQAWQVTREPELREAAEDALDWLLEDMRAPGGGFYAARDADSEGEEGLFYLWTPEQVEEVLEPEDARLFMAVYDVTESGNFEGRNILHLRRGLHDEAKAREMEPRVLQAELESLRQALEQARRQREEPLRDGKVLAGWNGLAIQALAEAGGALGRDDYVGAARAAMNWLLDVLRPEGPDGPLLHVWAVRGEAADPTDRTGGADRSASEAEAAATGEAKIPAFLEDVAALGHAALTLHEVTLERRWLDEARRMAERAVRDFRADDGLFYDTPREEAGGERLVIRPREIMDGATPSGTSLAAELCLRLGHLLGDEELLRVGRETVEGELDLVTRFPTGHGRLMSLAQGLLQPPVELAVVGEPGDPRTRGLLRVMLERYIPERTVTGRAPGEPTDGIPLLENREMRDGPDGSPAPTAWLCRDYACERPVTDPRELEGQFGRMEDGE